MLKIVSRPPREEAPGAIHHVIPRGNADRPIVYDDRDRCAFVARFARVGYEFQWLTHASCLMDTHHHAIVETPEANLADGMRRVIGGHSRWLNVRHGRRGSVFTPHFWSRRIGDEGWLFRACIYVVLNPVVAGLCDHPAAWSWCSYRATAEGPLDAYAPGEERLLSMFGRTPAAARLSYAKVIDDAVAGIVAERRSATAAWDALRELRPPLAS